MEELAQHRCGFVGQRRFVQRTVHQLDPSIPRRLIQLERHVTHAQPRMAALLFIPPWTTEPADQEITQPLFGAGEVVRRIHRPENVVRGNLAIEGGHQPAKAVFANPLVDLPFRDQFNHRQFQSYDRRMDDAPKSAIELAMERLKKKDAEAGVSEPPLTDDQKQEIAEVRSTYAARLAQEEILFKSKLQGLMDHDGRRALEDNYRRDVERLTHERDRKISIIRTRS